MTDTAAQSAPVETEVHTVFSGTHDGVREALANLMIVLTTAAVAQNERDATELVLAEVLTNIVKHAYPGSAGPIGLAVALTQSDLKCEVTDTGLPMPEGTLPAGLRAKTDVALDALPEGGFGWFLIRTLAQDIVYRRVADTNVLQFSITLSAPHVTG